MTLKKLRELLDAREISAPELTEAYIGRIDKFNGDLRAYVHVGKDAAAAAAVAAQARIDAGTQAPLTGIPVALDDNVCTKDMPTACASRMLDGYRPPYDAAVAERLRAQCAAPLGKLNAGEFGMGISTETSYYGHTKNPYADGSSPERAAGCAAGGMGAAVSAGLCAAAAGVDTGGSINRSAAFCGVTGFRPTYGFVSRHGCVAYASCFDQAGVVAAGSEDCAAILESIAGYCPKDPATSVFKRNAADKSHSGSEAFYGGDLKNVRIGLIRELFGGVTDAAVSDAVNGAAKWFESAGAAVFEVSLPMLEYGAAAFYVIAGAEASANLARFDGIRYGRRSETAGDYYDIVAKSRGEGFGPEVIRQLLFGTLVLDSEHYERYYKRAVSVAGIIGGQYDAAFKDADFLISPASFSVSPALSGFGQTADNCSFGPSLAGLPCVTTVCGYDAAADGAARADGLPADGLPAGLPIGFSITGRKYEDYKLLGIAGAFEGDFSRRPPVGFGGGLEFARGHVWR